MVDDERGWPCELLYHAGVFYTYWGHWLVVWSERGSNSFHELPIGVVCHVVRSVYSEELLLAIDAEEGFLLWAPTHPGEKKPTLAFTTGAAANVAIQFVAPAHLVVINEFGTALYQFAAGGTELAHTIAMDTELIAILSTINRQQFALLEATGRITLHQISHE